MRPYNLEMSVFKKEMSLRSQPMCFLAAVLLMCMAVEGQSKRRWLKRGYSDASQSFDKHPSLQCDDYGLVQNQFLSKYGPDAALSVYTWAPGPATSACPALNKSFSPMIWGAGTLLPPFNETIMPSSSTVKWSSVQGFCNPNLNSSDSSKMTPYEAAKLWPQIVRLARVHGDENTIIVSPAMNECIDNCFPDDETGDPVKWLQYFLSNCSAMFPHDTSMCQMDAISIHHYGNCTAAGLEKFIMLMYNNFKKPIWVTEFGCHWWPQKTDDDTLAYLKSALPMLESNEAVERYFFFTGRAPGFNVTQMFHGEGANTTLSAVGELYFGYPANFSKQ